MTAASKAFGAIKKGFAIGKDIESMGKDLGRWLSAVSDVDNTEKKAKNPSLLQKLFKGDDIKTSAIEAFTAKKKLEAQRQELNHLSTFTMVLILGMRYFIWKDRYESKDKKKSMNVKNFEERLLNG